MAGYRLAEISLELPPLVDVLVHGGVVELERAAVGALARIEGEIGRHQEIVGILAVFRPDRDADADTRADVIAADVVRMDDGLDQAICQRLEVASRLEVADHDRKLVAAKS